MGISDDKRREIAASLRESREFISCLPKTSIEQNAFNTFERILACVDYGRGNVFDYLADLIDQPDEMRGHPTCEMKGRQGERYGVCTRCGAFVRRDAVTNCTSVIPVKFCPNCRAKVI